MQIAIRQFSMRNGVSRPDRQAIYSFGPGPSWGHRSRYRYEFSISSDLDSSDAIAYYYIRLCVHFVFFPYKIRICI